MEYGKIMYAVVNKNFMGAMPLAITYEYGGPSFSCDSIFSSSSVLMKQRNPWIS